MSLPFILTTAGRNAIVNAQNTGTNPVVIASVGVGTSSWSPTEAATSLNSEVKKITAIGGGATADDIIHVTVEDSSSDSYTCREVGLFLADNTLLAIYSQALPIVQKEEASSTFIAVDLAITGLPAASITVGPTNFNLPAATQTVAGVIPLATGAEVNAGTNASKAVTPSSLLSRVSTTSQSGLVKMATQSEATARTANNVALSPYSVGHLEASDVNLGFVRVANFDDTVTGTSSTRVATPKNIAYSDYAAAAWINFTVTAGTVFNRGSYRVNALLDLGVGRYSVGFEAGTFLNDSDYTYFGSARLADNTDAAVSISPRLDSTKSRFGFEFIVSREGASGPVDLPEVSLVFFGRSTLTP